MNMPRLGEKEVLIRLEDLQSLVLLSTPGVAPHLPRVEVKQEYLDSLIAQNRRLTTYVNELKDQIELSESRKPTKAKSKAFKKPKKRVAKSG